MIRSRRQRILDILAALDRENELWISVVRADGSPHAIPLSFVWDGERIIIATADRSVTSSALRRTGKARLALPSTSDVIMFDVTATVVSVDQIDATTHMLFCRVAGFDPSATAEQFIYALLAPHRVLAWRDEPEIKQREVMRLGQWLYDD